VTDALPRYVIRQANGASHSSELTGLQYLCFPNDEVLPVNAGLWWLVWFKGNPVGFAGITFPKESFPNAAHLSRAGVLPDHRGKGLQRRLIEVRARKAKALGLTHLITTTYCNPVSSNNLIEYGFRCYTPNEPWGAEGTNYWIKEIA
jgi:GNAT superfamily N-acetyltransferase